MSPTARTFLTAGLFSAWIVLLFGGVSAGGAIHLLLLGALVAFPWKAARASDLPE